jgi:hypothetical protein
MDDSGLSLCGCYPSLPLRVLKNTGGVQQVDRLSRFVFSC